MKSWGAAFAVAGMVLAGYFLASVIGGVLLIIAGAWSH